MDNLKQLGHKIQYDKENNCYYIENVTFAGERWNLCQFEFYKDTLALVGFGLLSDNEDVVDLYNRNLENVKTKYSEIEYKHKISEQSYYTMVTRHDDEHIPVGRLSIELLTIYRIYYVNRTVQWRCLGHYLRLVLEIRSKSSLLYIII